MRIADVLDVRLTVHLTARADWLGERQWTEGAILGEPGPDGEEIVAGMIGSVGPVDHNGLREIGIRIMPRAEGRAIQSFTGWIMSLRTIALQREGYVVTVRPAMPPAASITTDTEQTDV
jgi:hypothetical protein